MLRHWPVAIVAGLLATPALGHVPPPPPDDGPIVTASCGAMRPVQPFEQVAAAVSLLAPATLKVDGRLRWRWGVRITTGDARVGGVTGLTFSGPYGLLAVTRDRRWLSFDLQSGTLADIQMVGVAQMKGAPGVPTSLATLYEERTYVAFGGDHPVVARYALGACGAASAAEPWLDIVGAADPIVVQGAYTYLGIVGRHTSEGSALVLPYQHRAVTLGGDNPLASSGESLIAASNPARIVPEIIVAQQAARGRATITLVTVNGWSDVLGKTLTPPVTLAVLPRAPAAMTSYYRSADKTTTIVLAYPGPRAGTLDLYAFDADVSL